jgi:hypothetical protein
MTLLTMSYQNDKLRNIPLHQLYPLHKSISSWNIAI